MSDKKSDASRNNPAKGQGTRYSRGQGVQPHECSEIRGVFERRSSRLRTSPTRITGSTRLDRMLVIRHAR